MPPLAEGGIPIDLLLRIVAQSIGGLQNGSASGGANSAGTPKFFQMLQAPRRLQLAGELNVELRSGGNGNGATKPTVSLVGGETRPIRNTRSRSCKT